MSKASQGQQTAKFKIKKGDQVMVISGKSKGTQGQVMRVYPNDAKVVVEGAGMVKRHTKGTQGQSGRIIERPSAIHISNVMLIDPTEKKPTRVGRRMEDGVLVRYAKKSGTIIK